MAESDSFIQEVSEEVRRDRMYAVWRRYGPILIALIVLMVVAAAGKSWWEGRVATQQAELGGALLAADDVDDPAAAAAAFLAVAEEGEGKFDYPVIARLRAAAALSQSGQLDEAQAQYERVRSTDGVDPRFRDLAELRTVMMRSDTMEPDAMLDRLGPLTVEGGVWRLPALEYEAAAHLRGGDPEAALSSLRAIIDDPQLPAGMEGRVGELIEAVEVTVEEEASGGGTTPEAEATPAPEADDDSSPAGSEEGLADAEEGASQ